MAGFLVSSHLQPAFASYDIAEGVKEYSCKTLEGNWNEERYRVAAGEKMVDRQLPAGVMMEGAEFHQKDPDVSIAPPIRDPFASSSGRLEMPDRLRRSKMTNDSSRQVCDDGYREYTSMNTTFFPPYAQRPSQPICTDPEHHSTWGGPIQSDDRIKGQRCSPECRSKNTEVEPAIMSDGDALRANKFIGAETIRHSSVPRESTYSSRTGEFGSVVPHLPKQVSEEERLQSTSRLLSSWMGPEATTYRTVPAKTRA